MQSTWDFRTSSSRDLSHRVYRVFTHLPVLRPDISAISPSYREDPPSTFQSSSLLLPFEVSFDISVVASLKLNNTFLSFDLLSLLDETDANGIKENLISFHFACTKIIKKVTFWNIASEASKFQLPIIFLILGIKSSFVDHSVRSPSQIVWEGSSCLK